MCPSSGVPRSFFWKATPDSQDHAGVKSKIMRAVSYPDVLDVYDFCSETIKVGAAGEAERKRRHYPTLCRSLKLHTVGSSSRMGT